MIGLAALVIVQTVDNNTYLQPQKTVNLSHPFE